MEEMWSYAYFLMIILSLAESTKGQNNTTHITSTGSPQTPTSIVTGRIKPFWNNIEMMQRAFYVLIGISLLAVLYFVIRTCTLKKKPQRKKYGLLSDYDENMEMASLDSDEEKIFESRRIRR
ncbi:protein FAM174C [Pseudophryne corroboree]|uniref:protein FAM174C n=1 Tax=Pseudophryne corroboree TaxID=495146 RepID=UPI00308146CA